MRLIQPTRALLPGSASSSSSMASKWLRLGAGSPTACTAARLPACHQRDTGANFGCRPNVASACSSSVALSAVVGRAAW